MFAFVMFVFVILRVEAVRLPAGRITKLDRSKLDTSDDRNMYRDPNLVTHVDDAFLDQLTQLYREKLRPGATILDLCSSHVSHLPPEIELARVDAHGLNAAELAANPAVQLTGGSTFVHDLNAEPALPFADTAAYDAVLCCVGVQVRSASHSAQTDPFRPITTACCLSQYLQQPERVLAEVARVLRPDGLVTISFSNKFFFQKAITGWVERGMATRARLVRDYLRAAGGYENIEVVGSGTGLFTQAMSLSGLGADPFCAVVATRDDS